MSHVSAAHNQPCAGASCICNTRHLYIFVANFNSSVPMAFRDQVNGVANLIRTPMFIYLDLERCTQTQEIPQYMCLIMPWWSTLAITDRWSTLATTDTVMYIHALWHVLKRAMKQCSHCVFRRTLRHTVQ